MWRRFFLPIRRRRYGLRAPTALCGTHPIVEGRGENTYAKTNTEDSGCVRGDVMRPDPGKLAFRIIILTTFIAASLMISHDFRLLLTRRPENGFLVIILPSVEQALPVLGGLVTVFVGSISLASKLPRQPRERRITGIGIVIFLLGALYSLTLVLNGLLFSTIPSTLDYPILVFMIGLGYAFALPEIIAERAAVETKPRQEPFADVQLMGENYPISRSEHLQTGSLSGTLTLLFQNSGNVMTSLLPISWRIQNVEGMRITLELPGQRPSNIDPNSILPLYPRIGMQSNTGIGKQLDACGGSSTIFIDYEFTVPGGRRIKKSSQIRVYLS